MVAGGIFSGLSTTVKSDWWGQTHYSFIDDLFWRAIYLPERYYTVVHYFILPVALSFTQQFDMESVL